MKQAIIWLVKIGFAVLIVWSLIHSSQLDFSLLVSLFTHPVLLTTIFSLILVTILLNAWRWYRLSQALGINNTYRQAVFPTYLGIAFNSLLPGSIGGDFVRLHYLFRRVPEQKSRIFCSILLDRVIGLMGIIVLVFMFVLPNMHLLMSNQELFYILSICFLFCAGGIAAFVFSILISQHAGVNRWLNSYTHRFGVKSLLLFLESMQIYKNKKLTILECLAVSVMMQFLVVVVITLMSRAMGFPPFNFTSYVLAMGIAQVINLIPATPGGLGIGELAFANIMLLLTADANAPFATIFLAYRLTSLLVYLPGVAVYLFGKSNLDAAKRNSGK